MRRRPMAWGDGWAVTASCRATPTPLRGRASSPPSPSHPKPKGRLLERGHRLDPARIPRSFPAAIAVRRARPQPDPHRAEAEGFAGAVRQHAQDLRRPGIGAGGPEDPRGAVPAAGEDPQQGRSEEHTSELQSLMRISYAVFCLKKKKHKP